MTVVPTQDFVKQHALLLLGNKHPARSPEFNVQVNEGRASTLANLPGQRRFARLATATPDKGYLFS